MRILLLFAAISCLGVAPAVDSRPYLHSQQLVDVGGRRLNLYCIGSGLPTVVLDAGLGGTTWDWRFVQWRIARTTRVCSYDRSGMGFSDAGPNPRDASALVSDLHTLLHRAAIPGPYVLVGHSIAGLYDPLFVYRYPNEVAGLVMVDPSFPYQSQVFAAIAPAFEKLNDSQISMDRQCAAAARAGTIRSNQKTAVFCGVDAKSLAASCKSEPAACSVYRLQDEAFSKAAPWDEVLSEMLSLRASSDELVHARRPLGSLPIIVLTAQNTMNFAVTQVGKARAHAMWLEWKKAHEALAAQSTVGASFVVNGAGHYIQVDRPAAVTSAVEEIVMQARHSMSGGTAGFARRNVDGGYFALIGVNARGSWWKSKPSRLFARQSV